uniref:ribonucleoside-diphosphate reductase n=1 Tax=viral metagenome TaxID=1070528 RepID=A0A6C0C679_9ZZZZ
MQANNALKEPIHDDDNIYIVIDNKVNELKKELISSLLKEICTLNNLMHLDIAKLADRVFSYMKKFNTIDDINKQIILTASEMVTEHYDYPSIATFILLYDLHSKTLDDYSKTVKQMRSNLNPKGESAPLVSNKFAKYVFKNKHAINKILATNKNRDYNISLFGYRTLEKAYLKKLSHGKILERPQCLFMRVAIAIHHRKNDLAKIEETYNLTSEGYFTHATPTLFNAGTSYEQLSSCFLLGTADDMGKIGDCWKECGLISKHAGGIGITMTPIRVNGAYINSTQGTASGLKVLSVFNEISRYADQSGKRPGSIAIYIEPWHADIFYFLDLKKNTGAETERARDLFLALMINDIFMERVEADGVWSLMCPHDCPNLLDKFGDEFSKIYKTYEKMGKFVRQISARELWFKIMEAQIETGVPYMLYKNAVNKKSNQINIGVVNGSNLCCEILEVSTSDEYAVCFTSDTEIVTDKGIKKIIECDGENVLSYFNNDIDLQKSEHYEKATLIHNGQKEVYALKTIGNKTINATEDHPFLIAGNEWKKVKDLKIGDKIMTPEISILDSYKSKSAVSLQQAKFLSDYFSVNGQIIETESNTCIYTFSDDGDKLYQIQGMLIPFGIKSKVQFDNIVNQWNLLISGRSVVNFDVYIGFANCPVKKEQLKNYVVNAQTDDYSAVVSIQKVGVRDVYDLSLKHSHNFIANGHVVHNCNLASICLPKFVENNEFNHQKLFEVTKVATRNLNNIIDINFYPVEKARISNMKHRPIGLGVQGLADTFFKLKLPFDSPKARELNKRIFETIYFGAMTESCLMAKESGYYSTYPGSPISQGKFQFDLWGVSRDTLMWDWNSLQKEIEQYGVRNSLTTAEMPTASTSQIMGNVETIEAITSNIYTRKTIAGDYYVINKYLMSDLMDLGLWNSEMIDMIKYYEGSIQKIPGIPQDIKEIYRTVYEIDQRSIIDMSADRGPFIDQTQSLNLHIAEPDFAKLNSCHFHAWKSGLKTGMYYLRSKPASEANKFGIDIDTIRMIEERDGIVPIEKVEEPELIVKSCQYNPNRKNGEGCMMCGS